jgi:hypothetical protein
MPALVYGLVEGGRKLPLQKIRDGMLAATAISYLCKHHATLSAAEGGCQAEIGVASSMAAALVATAHDAESRVVENAAESALEHLGMTCDPVAGYNEIASRHRVDFDATVQALAQTAKEMNSKYKETSEAGLALSVVLCWSRGASTDLDEPSVHKSGALVLHSGPFRRRSSPLCPLQSHRACFLLGTIRRLSGETLVKCPH